MLTAKVGSIEVRRARPSAIIGGASPNEVLAPPSKPTMKRTSIARPQNPSA